MRLIPIGIAAKIHLLAHSQIWKHTTYLQAHCLTRATLFTITHTHTHTFSFRFVLSGSQHSYWSLSHSHTKLRNPNIVFWFVFQLHTHTHTFTLTRSLVRSHMWIIYVSMIVSSSICTISCCLLAYSSSRHVFFSFDLTVAVASQLCIQNTQK